MSAEVNVLSPHWREVATHAVAFTGAVLILRKYAWRPILGLLDERRAKIQGEFETIDREKGHVKKLASEYEAQLKTIDAQARVKLQEAVGEGQKVASEIRDVARHDARDLLQRAREDVEIEKRKAELALKEDMVRLALGAAEKVIRSKLDPAMHNRLISDAIDEMEGLKSP
jgi:F-type H+-transporting ATPase subunit b